MSFEPSKLGTRAHWDQVYEEEIQNFEDIGDEGEVWFGEESMQKMVEWVIENASPPRTILEVGTGNGVLLCELAKNGYDTSYLLGIDYSPGSNELCRRVAKRRGVETIRFDQHDILLDDPPKPQDKVGDGVGLWDLVLDKGTFDAIALSKPDALGRIPGEMYPTRIAQLLAPEGFFLLTSCNFTEDELKERFITKETGLTYHSRIQHKVYTFRGKSGTICSSVAFRKAGK